MPCRSLPRGLARMGTQARVCEASARIDDRRSRDSHFFCVISSMNPSEARGGERGWSANGSHSRAGNSPQMIFRQYRELAPAGDALKWFSIAPKQRE